MARIREKSTRPGAALRRARATPAFVSRTWAWPRGQPAEVRLLPAPRGGLGGDLSCGGTSDCVTQRSARAGPAEHRAVTKTSPQRSCIVLQHRGNRARPACSVGVFSALKSRLNNNDCDIRARTLQAGPGSVPHARSAWSSFPSVRPGKNSPNTVKRAKEKKMRTRRWRGRGRLPTCRALREQVPRGACGEVYATGNSTRLRSGFTPDGKVRRSPEPSVTESGAPSP